VNVPTRIRLNLLAAKSNLARAQRDCRAARVALEWAPGTLDRPAPAP
jgi:hypothetical protein